MNIWLYLSKYPFSLFIQRGDTNIKIPAINMLILKYGSRKPFNDIILTKK
ncbi:hypothetical protein [Methanobrevibacter woesei]|nr:hypothetical protein [Methanobrevibacter woesei]